MIEDEVIELKAQLDRKSLNRELSAVCSTLSVSPVAISIGIPAWSTGQSIGLGIGWQAVNRYLELVPLP